MWYSENQRLGMKECSYAAYLLESWGDSLNTLSILLLILSLIAVPVISYFYGWVLLFVILIPPFLFILGAVMRGGSESILKEKGFAYDYESDTWVKDKIINAR
jgi:hypothetical protein